MRTLLAVVILLVGCGGGEGSECRSREECDDGLFCSGPNNGPGCGIAPQEECGSNLDCQNTDVCHAIFDSCSADGIGSRCGVACVDDQECGQSFTCDAGSCVAQPCDAGFACAGREVCDPSRITSTTPIFDRHHGCFAVSCDLDDDCGERFCVNGICQDGVGTCAEPLLVP